MTTTKITQRARLAWFSIIDVDKAKRLQSIIFATLLFVFSSSTITAANAVYNSDPNGEYTYQVATIVDIAKSNQVKNYKQDDYALVELNNGDFVYALFTAGGASDFYTNQATIQGADGKRVKSAQELAEKLQVSKNAEWGDRQIIAAYQINLPKSVKLIKVAGGQCKANITYGIGGGQQYLIPKTCLSGPVGYFVYEKDTLVCVYKKPNITIPNVGPGGTIPFITNQL